MTPRQLKAALMLKGIRQVDLAKTLGVTYTSIWTVVNGRNPSPRIRHFIANALGKTIEEIWPSKTA